MVRQTELSDLNLQTDYWKGNSRMNGKKNRGKTKEKESNEIPGEWEIKKLSAVAKIILGQSPPSSNFISQLPTSENQDVL